ncbi:TipAS antibiotic-recognition domain-containing protein, partial [Clostridium sp.]|uniref:TipAS antibiotic-recognition domain-containing protein n=1 Tax=Clostridium sp. TaxID=1506 RepID=UPI003463D145
LSKDPSSKEIQQIAEEITNTAKRDYEIFKMDNGDDHWYYMAQLYLVYPEWIEVVDKKYGHGASKFIGKALKNYLGDKQPKLEELYTKLAADLSKDPYSKEIQQIVEEISDANKESQEFYKVDEGENHWGYTAELYLSNSTWIKAIDKQYGSGASKFIGEALKFYSENSKSLIKNYVGFDIQDQS